MSKPSHCRIYIHYQGNLCDFMWADTAKDGSVIIGLTERGKDFTHAIWDANLGELRPGSFLEAPSMENPKTTFHVSGHYKMTTRVGMLANAIDRCTIIGPPLEEILEPRLMMEVLLPNKLRIAGREPSEQDIILNATEFPNKPLRCTISCMSTPKFHEIINSQKRFVGTSIVEFTHALETNSHVWSFTLRVSREDNLAADIYHLFVPGEIKWGKSPNKAV